MVDSQEAVFSVFDADTPPDVGERCLRLERFTQEFAQDGRRVWLGLGRCASLRSAFEFGNNATLFFYLDPYGIKELDLDTVRPIYERDKQQSTEVLLSFSVPTFLRMSGNRMLTK